MPPPQELLTGHLGLARVLLQLPSFDASTKTTVGTGSGVGTSGSGEPGRGLVVQLLDVFLFPAHKHIAAARAKAASPPPSPTKTLPPSAGKRKRDSSTGVSSDGPRGAAAEPADDQGASREEEAEPACRSPASREAAERLLLSLCTDSVLNLSLTSKLIQQVHGCTSGVNSVSPSFSFSADTGRRAEVGFVGLKNLGATCYMNAVMQNLFMQPCIREVVLRTWPEK